MNLWFHMSRISHDKKDTEIDYSNSFKNKFSMPDCSNSQSKPSKSIFKDENSNKNVQNDIQCFLLRLIHVGRIQRHVDHEKEEKNDVDDLVSV